MPLTFAPKPGTVIVCDYRVGFIVPEMVKRRPAIVISPQMQGRANLCTVVPISTDIPRKIMAYHLELPNLVLPEPFAKGPNWVKADLVFAASFQRCDLIKAGRNDSGKRQYELITITDEELNAVRGAVLCSIGLSSLTKHLL